MTRLRYLIIGLLTWSTIALTPDGSTAQVRFHVRGALSDEATDPASPLLIHFPGIGGTQWVDHMFVHGLHGSGVIGIDSRIIDWTKGRQGVGGLNALSDYHRNRSEARRIAGIVRRLADANPGRPILLSGHSGGSGIVIWVLEALPEHVRVDQVILLAPALSPTYDLSPALRRVSKRMLVLTSRLDHTLLGRGTKAFGTIDRVYTEAAGLVGFVLPSDGGEGGTFFRDPEQYRKLVPLPYQAAWIRYGHTGGHIGAMMRPFVEHVLTPMLRSDDDDHDDDE